MRRLGKALAALLMWVAFSVGTVAALACVLVAIIAYALNGSAWLEKYIGWRGKSFDQVCNTYWFGGHPKETISSHAGRLLEREMLQGAPAPAWARAVRWITDIAEKDHVLKAIEEPFRGMPL